MGRLVTAALWLADRPLTQPELVEQISDTFQVSLRPEQIEQLLAQLVEASTVMPSAPIGFRLAEHVLLKLRAELEMATEMEARTRDRFAQAVDEHCRSMDVDELWRDFNERMLFPTVATIGARTYDLVTGGYRDIDTVITLKAFLGKYPENLREALRKTVGQFLDPDDLDVRAYILRHMNAYFVIEASSLSQATVDGLAVLAGQQPSFVAFADTNFVFSVLGLHAEHVNEAAHQLVQLIESVTRRVEVKLCILPPTVSEMHTALEMERDDLTEVRWTPNIARGALESGSLGDVGRHFAAACIKANRTLNPHDYFEPYISNPVATLRASGVELFNANFDAYYESRGVEQDIKWQMVAQERIARGARRSRAQARAPAKSKAQIKHDTVLWHFVRDKRPTQVDSPMDAKYWILTEDFRFIAFDTAKRGRNQGDVPICVHPLALIQMLQFWAGRTPELEQALVGSLRMSFLFQPFDANAERVTVRILERLSSYEDAHDLPQQVITATLLNQAIRQRIEANPSEQEEAAIIKEAVTTGFKAISDSLAADRDRIAAEREIEASRRREAEEGKAVAAGEAGALTAQLTSTMAALNQAVAERDAERSARAGLQQRIVQLEEQAQHQADEAVKVAQRVTVRRHVRRFLILEVLLPGAAVVAVATIAGWLYHIHQDDLLVAWQKMTIATALMILVGALFYIDQRGKRNQVVVNCPWFQRYHAMHGWLYVVVLTGVLINFATDLLKWLVS